MKRIITTAILWLMLLSSDYGYAKQRIAIVNFELNDITSLPYTQAELRRTASMAPMLSALLSQTNDYEIVPIDGLSQQSANAGFGYLFRFHDLAALLGQQYAADWIIVSQHSKPSFLFSYVISDLIEVKSQKLIARYDIELKGNHEKVTQHSIARLAEKIQASLLKQKS